MNHTTLKLRMTRTIKFLTIIVTFIACAEKLQAMHVEYKEIRPKERDMAKPSESNVNSISTNNPPAAIPYFSSMKSFNTLGIKPFSVNNSYFAFKNPEFENIKGKLNRSSMTENNSYSNLEKAKTFSNSKDSAVHDTISEPTSPVSIHYDFEKIIENNPSLKIQVKPLDTIDTTIKMSEKQQEEDGFFDTNQGPDNAFQPKTVTPEYKAKIEKNNMKPRNEYFGYDRVADRGYSKYQAIIEKNASSKVPEQLKERIIYIPNPKYYQYESRTYNDFIEIHTIAQYYKAKETLTPEECRDYYVMRQKEAKNLYDRQAMRNSLRSKKPALQ